MSKKLLLLPVLLVVLLAGIVIVSKVAPLRPAQNADAAENETLQAAEDPGAHIVMQSGPSYSAKSAAISPDGRTVGSLGGTIKLWDVASGHLLRTFTGSAESVAFSPDGRTALSGGFDGINLWDIANRHKIRAFTWDSKSKWICSVAFSPDGRTALSGDNMGAFELWDVASGREIRTFTGNSGYFDSVVRTDFVSSVAFSPDGHSVLSGNGRRIKLWDVASGRLLRIFELDYGGAVAFSLDGRSVLSKGADNTVKLWDISNASTLWDRMRSSVMGGNEPRTFAGHSSDVNSIAFSLDGRIVLSGSDDGSTRLWDRATGAALATLSSFDDESWLAITPEGFYDSSSPQGVQKFGVVRGLDVCSDDKVYNTLYRPDLVREQLAGDPNGKVKAAAAQLDLDKVCFGSEH